MNFLVASSLRNNLRRLIATATAVALSVAFMVATLLIMGTYNTCLLYTSPSPRDQRGSRMPSSA